MAGVRVAAAAAAAAAAASSINEFGAHGRCALPYEDYFNALSKTGWMRFYEFFGE
jgi:hypothetical protein